MRKMKERSFSLSVPETHDRRQTTKIHICFSRHNSFVPIYFTYLTVWLLLQNTIDCSLSQLSRGEGRVTPGGRGAERHLLPLVSAYAVAGRYTVFYHMRAPSI